MLLLSIDQGTTSTRAMLFDRDGRVRAAAQQEHQQIYPAPGEIEHDADEIWTRTLAVTRAALAQADAPVVALGITNQRETVVIWDARTGAPIANAIVWQDRRTADFCAGLKAHEAEVTARTGLLLDPYFSASKIVWLLDHVPGARGRAERGELRMGTMDCFLLWRLTGGRVHATDATNASRTMLYNIHDGRWDDWLLDLFGVPKSLLPEVRDSVAAFGVTDPALFGQAIPITGIAGDQQAATVGQACFAPGMVKCTHGTGSFLMLNTGARAVPSQHHLLTTIAYQFDGKPTYALEGSVFSAGVSIKWLRDGLGLIGSAAEADALAERAGPHKGVYLVPAFSGLGAPYWDAAARGVICGLTAGSDAGDLARAALEAVAYQTRDLVAAMTAEFAGDAGASVLRVDGGLTNSRWLMRFMADMLGRPVDVPDVAETTALGAAFLAGLGAGVYDGLDDIAAHWRRAARYEPTMPEPERRALYAGWQAAVRRTLG
ncbi:glycerol kinase GlpK [Govanella unica]|uniref:glycerol kinase n=1 Tax=Govanella unica TaxID=2975056 RepID=A0A9X3TVP3_9PROT|nr:glycerol kinase GlpK [Govania unica]MDA5192581.1 glycerol kinase GlpK [Govania unica]